MSEYHVPVLLNESIDLLDIKPSGVYADLTFGGGGHSREILNRLDKNGTLIGFDQDLDAMTNIPYDERFIFIRNNFRFMRGCIRAEGFESVDGVLADLGVSSHHFDTGERGFSFRSDARLDMRMNRESKLTAWDVINNYDKEKLKNILRSYGELDGAGRIAHTIISRREEQNINTIEELKEAVHRFTPRAAADENKFMAKLFQALRIEVNGEIEALRMMLEQSLRILRPGGRLVVITYHSLEDRLVKNFMKTGNVEGKQDKDFFGKVSTQLEIITRKALVPSDAEIERNSRSRSAKLRAAEKL